MMLVPANTVISVIDGKRVRVPAGRAYSFDEETGRALLESGAARIASNLDPMAKVELALDSAQMAAGRKKDLSAEAIAEAAARGVAAALEGKPNPETPKAAAKPAKAKAKSEDGDEL